MRQRPRQEGVESIKKLSLWRRSALEAIADLAQQDDVFRGSGGLERGAGAGASRLSRLICLIIMKMMNARMMKLTATVKKLP